MFWLIFISCASLCGTVIWNVSRYKMQLAKPFNGKLAHRQRNQISLFRATEVTKSLFSGIKLTTKNCENDIYETVSSGIKNNQVQSMPIEPKRELRI